MGRERQQQHGRAAGHILRLLHAALSGCGLALCCSSWTEHDGMGSPSLVVVVRFPCSSRAWQASSMHKAWRGCLLSSTGSHCSDIHLRPLARQRRRPARLLSCILHPACWPACDQPPRGTDTTPMISMLRLLWMHTSLEYAADILLYCLLPHRP